MSDSSEEVESVRKSAISKISWLLNGTFFDKSNLKRVLSVLWSACLEENLIGFSLEGLKKAVNHLYLGMKISYVDLIFSHYDSNSTGFNKFRNFPDASTHHLGWNGFWLNDPSRIEHPSYDYTKSTNENHGVDQLVFYGKYRDIRKRMDYNYHTNYTKARQLWQDAVISSLFACLVPQKNPYIIYTCGAMGVGKGYVLRWLLANEYLPLKQMVRIDPDYFKIRMPEWLEYVKRDFASAGTLCHRESTFIQEIAQEVALSKRQHALIEGSLRDHAWFAGVFNDIKTRFPEYGITIIYVHAPARVVRERISKRARETGRKIPDHLIQNSLVACDDSVKFLANKVDLVVKVNNGTGKTPVVDAFEWKESFSCWKRLQLCVIFYKGFKNRGGVDWTDITDLYPVSDAHWLEDRYIPQVVKDRSFSCEMELEKEATPISSSSSQNCLSRSSRSNHIPKPSHFTACCNQSWKIEQQKARHLNITWKKALFLACGFFYFDVNLNHKWCDSRY